MPGLLILRVRPRDRHRVPRRVIDVVGERGDDLLGSVTVISDRGHRLRRLDRDLDD